MHFVLVFVVSSAISLGARELSSPNGYWMWQLRPTKLSMHIKYLRSSVLPSEERGNLVRQRAGTERQSRYPAQANPPCSCSVGQPGISIDVCSHAALESAGHKRGYLRPLKKALRWHADHRYHKAIAGAGEGESPPQEGRSRASRRHEHPKGGGSGKPLSPTRRRVAVVHVRGRLDVSERRVFKVIGEPRSTQRYTGQRARRD